MTPRHIGVGRAGTNRVDGDPIGTELTRQRFYEADDRRFRRRIVGKLTRAVMSDRRCDADYAPAFLPAHGGNEGAGAEKVAAEIDVECAIPVFLGLIDHRRFEVDAGVVDQNIDPAKALESSFGEPLD